ncbi:alpha/beta fold hydrolase [Thalassotalea fusca]
MTDTGIYQCGKGSAVITLHSSLSSGRQWLPISSQLKHAFSFFHVDLLRYGSAAKLQEGQVYRFDLEVKRILKLLNEQQINTPVHLVGHSCGGAVALKFAVEYPEYVKSLTLFEPVAFHLLEQGSRFRLVADDFARDVATHEGAKAAEIFTNFWNRPGFYAELPDKLKQLMANDMTSVNQDFLALTTETYTLAELATLCFPVLMLAGKQSPALSRHLAQLIVDYLPNATIEHLDVGHMGPVNQSDIVQPRIARFIETVEAVSK